jgi:hypothetical protein
VIINIIGFFGFFGWFLVFAAAPSAGGLIAEAARRATRRHRSRGLFISMAAAFALGALPIIIINIFFFNLFGLIFQTVYLLIGLPTFYYRLSGIQLGR